MRKTDVKGGATRSDAVWLTLACEFVAKRIQDREAQDTDVVSVISMSIEGTISIDRQPTDWVLYNRIVDLLRSSEPHFDGNYLPSLRQAESLLMHSTAKQHCALTLSLLSDGKRVELGHIRTS